MATRFGSKIGVLLACVASVSLAFVSIAPGCANGNGDDVENLPKNDAARDTAIRDGISEGGGDDTGGGGDSGTGTDSGPPDTGPTCGDIGITNTCETVTDLGSVALAAVKTFPGNLPVAGGDAWFKVTFESLEDPTAHPHIVIKGATGATFLFEAFKDCTKENLGCGDEDAMSTKVTDFEEKYAPDPGATDTGDPGAATGLVPIALGPGGTVYLRVFRGGPPSACDGFNITVSN